MRTGVGAGMMGGVGAIVVVTGAGGPVGRQAIATIAADPGVSRVVAVDAALAPAARVHGVGGADVRVAPFALDDPRLAIALAGASVLVHLGPVSGLELDGTGGTGVDLDGFARVLDVVEAVGCVDHLVVLSSGLVYGSRDDNPVPLTETAAVRPHPRVGMAVAKARLETMAGAWALDHGATCTILRPSLVVSVSNGRWLSRSPWSTTGLQVRGVEPPVQFLHVDDLAAAVGVVLTTRVEGAVNVAPDGWLAAHQLRALKGPTWRLRLPRRTAYTLARVGLLLGSGRGSPDELLAGTGPWVLANDRLRALGWEPGYTSAEAFVEADTGGPWARLTPRHRQAIALGAGVSVVLGGLGVVVGLVFRRRRRRPPTARRPG